MLKIGHNFFFLTGENFFFSFQWLEKKRLLIEGKFDKGNGKGNTFPQVMDDVDDRKPGHWQIDIDFLPRQTNYHYIPNSSLIGTLFKYWISQPCAHHIYAFIYICMYIKRFVAKSIQINEMEWRVGCGKFPNWRKFFRGFVHVSGIQN